MSKTPVTILQEYCAQKRIVPQYELVINGVGTHDPLFRYKLIVATEFSSVVTYGDGKSKKEAKHEAARLSISKLEIQPNVSNNQYIVVDNTPEEDIQSPYQGSIKENNVGKLSTICCEMTLPYPVYNLIGEEGPPHAKSFTFECCLAQLKENASSRTKKQAKHLAASKMIERLTHIVGPNILATREEELPIKKEVKENVEMSAEDETAKIKFIETKAKTLKINSNLGEHLSERHNINVAEICGFQEDFIDFLKSYNDNLMYSIDPVEFLCKNFENVGKTVTFNMLFCSPNQTLYTCEMDCYPYYSTLGTGKDVEQSKKQAAHLLLLHLSLVL